MNLQRDRDQSCLVGTWVFVLVWLVTWNTLVAESTTTRNNVSPYRPTSELLTARAKLHRHLTKLAGKPVLRASAANLQAVDNWLQVRDYGSVLHDLPSLAALVARCS